MSLTPEKIVKNKVVAWLKLHNIPYWYIIPSHFGNSTGMADLCCILPSGKWLAIEVKAKGKKSNLTPHQRKFLKTISDNNGYSFVVDREEDLLEIEKVINV
jgi:hypothetical protein